MSRFRLPRRKPDQLTEEERAAQHDAAVERFVADFWRSRKAQRRDVEDAAPPDVW